MKKIAILKFVAVLVLLFLACVQYLFMQNYYLNSDIIGSLIVFLSISFGFYIASLTIFATSSFVAGLYKITDSENRSRTLLHTLIKNYKFGLISILISIFYFIVIQFILAQLSSQLSLGSIVALPLLFVVLFNFYYTYTMLDSLIKVIIQQAKDNSIR